MKNQVPYYKNCAGFFLHLSNTTIVEFFSLKNIFLWNLQCENSCRSIITFKQASRLNYYSFPHTIAIIYVTENILNEFHQEIRVLIAKY